MSQVDTVDVPFGTMQAPTTENVSQLSQKAYTPVHSDRPRTAANVPEGQTAQMQAVSVEGVNKMLNEGPSQASPLSASDPNKIPCLPSSQLVQFITTVIVSLSSDASQT